MLLITCFARAIYDMPAWNWYGSLALYTAGHLAGWFVSWAITGMVMAALVKQRAGY